MHKVIVSSLRRGRSAKSPKDLEQAAILFAALAETQSGAIESALEALSRSAATTFNKALPSVLPILATFPRAVEALRS